MQRAVKMLKTYQLDKMLAEENEHPHASDKARCASATCSADPTDDPAYQAFVNECAKHCTCEPPHPCPCDGVLAGGLCDEMIDEPDFTMDDLDWHEAYE